MSLTWHLLFHLTLCITTGLLIWIVYNKFLLPCLFSVISGFFIDLDHLFDYFLSFGWQFNTLYFINGYQFLKSGKIYVILHAWEYVIILAVIAFIIQNKTAKIIFYSMALGLFFHLSADSILNEGIKPRAYSLIYRTENNFNIEKLVTPEHYQKYLKQKETVNFQ